MASFSEFETHDWVEQAADGLITPDRLRQRALAWLARREYSRLEMQRRLAKLGGSPAHITTLLDDFCQRGWLSDQRFAESRTHARQARSGTQRIAQELRQLGVADDIISQTLAPLQEDELARARTLWQKKFGQLPQDANDRVRQYRYLLARGFAADLVRQILRFADEE